MTGLLEVTGLGVDLGGSRILADVGFEVPPTGVTTLLGRNGVGKSSTVKAVLGLYPSTGSIRLDGRDLRALPTHRIARLGVGYVPEDRAVFGALTVAENLRLAEPPRVPAAKRSARYERVYDLFPVLRDRSAQAAGTLSGGEQQMLALARVLLDRKQLLLIDEPTKGLAPKVAADVAAALKQIATEVPILLVEQNLAVVRRMAQGAIVLDNGRVSYRGAARDLLADPALANELLGVSGARV